MSIRIDASKLLRGMVEHQTRLQKGIELYAETSAKKLESEAKKNAPWTDRTTLARTTITGTAERKGRKMVIALAGNMEYSIYLEEARNGKYAILNPTIEKNRKDILEGLGVILNR